MMHATAPVDELLSVVAEPTRARIVAELARESLCTCHLVEILGAGQTAVSNHLRVLRLAGRRRRRPRGPVHLLRAAVGRRGRHRRALRRPGLLLPDRRSPTVLTSAPLGRRLLAEALGTGLLVTVVVGSGIAASRLSPDDTGLQLLQNSTATALGLTVLILLVGPVSGAHLNPVVSAADWLVGRRSGSGLPGRDVAPYALAQTAGAIAGAELANVMYDVSLADLATTERSAVGLWVGEIVATAGLVVLVLALVRTGRTALAAPAVGAYIGAAYWFTSSTSFANPAVTVGRVFSDTFAGIAPSSVPAFVLAQVVGAAVGLALALALYPVRSPA